MLTKADKSQEFDPIGALYAYPEPEDLAALSREDFTIPLLASEGLRSLIGIDSDQNSMAELTSMNLKFKADVIGMIEKMPGTAFTSSKHSSTVTLYGGHNVLTTPEMYWTVMN